MGRHSTVGAVPRGSSARVTVSEGSCAPVVVEGLREEVGERSGDAECGHPSLRALPAEFSRTLRTYHAHER